MRPESKNVERDLVGGLLAHGPFHQRNHSIEEGFSRVGRDLDDDLVGKHGRPAGDGASIAAGFADHGSRFTGDSRLIDGRHPFDDGSIGGNHLARFDDDDVALFEVARSGTSSMLHSSLRRWAFVSWRALRSASACAFPRPSAIASAKLAKSTVNQSQSVICPLKHGLPAVTA